MHTKSRNTFWNKKWDYLSYMICFAGGVLLAEAGRPFGAGILLMAEGVVLYMLNFRRSGSLVDIRGVFSLSWVAGIGLTCLKLSRLQQSWGMMTWLCFFCAYACFMLGYDVLEMCRSNARGAARQQGAEEDTEHTICSFARDERQAGRIFQCMMGLSAASIGCFLLEAAVVGFIPLFSPEPHAYSYFHVSGVHYVTISCILNPALTVLYVRTAEKKPGRRLPWILAANVTAAAIPVLCVSRFQLLFAVGFAAVTYLMLYRKVTWKMILGAVVVMVPAYILLTIARRHDVSYLNSIFEMKNAQMPIFVTQPYMYVANNFENFNCLVTQLPEHTMGLRMLFPVFALTGLKFVFPQLVSFPLYITKEELTTLTMFYDAYYDFGIWGMIGFAFILGVAAAWLTGRVKKSSNPAVFLFYGQIAIYFGLAFFTTWFSNPTTWFWLALTGAMYIWIGKNRTKPGYCSRCDR